MKRFLAFILLHISVFTVSNYPENFYSIKLGEITRVEPLTGYIEVSVYNLSFLDALKDKTVESLLILESLNTGKKELVIKSYRVMEKEIIVQCLPMAGQKGFYVGQAVGLLKTAKTEPLLKDRVTTEKITQTSKISPIDSSQMVLIPEGPFIYGSDIPGTDHYTTPIEYELTEIQKSMGKKRVRYLHLNSYYIDKYEVTIELFNRFIRETATDPPPGWQSNQDPGLPVSNASYTMAENYCKWAGKRLPNELEWEKASRGPGILTSYIKDDIEFYREKINVYPTGLVFEEDKCITAETSGKTQNVYLLKDSNYYSLYGMCGNASEWTSSWYMPYRGNSMENPNYGRKFKVIRGGAYNLPSKWTKSYERMVGGIPTLSNDYRAGFRCAMDP